MTQLDETVENFNHPPQLKEYNTVFIIKMIKICYHDFVTVVCHFVLAIAFGHDYR